MKAAILTVIAGLAVPGLYSYEQSGREVSLTLATIEETRRVVIEQSEDDPGFFMDQPGLRLTYALELGAGVGLMSFEQPGNLRATDSEGNDLTEIEANFYGEKEYLSSMSMGGSDGNLTLNLALPARAATTFSVAGGINATTYSGTVERAVQLKSSWVSLDPADFAGQPVRIRFGPMEGFGGETWCVEMEPPSAETVVEDILVEYEGDEVESDGWMSDGRRISYMFEADFEDDEPVTVKLMLRTGITNVVFKIDEQNRPLP